MGWDTVFQVLAMLLGAGLVYKSFFTSKDDGPLVIYNDSAPPALPAVSNRDEDALQASLRGELEALAEQKRELLGTQQNLLKNGLTGSASSTASAIAAIDKRLDKVRNDWEDYY